MDNAITKKIDNDGCEIIEVKFGNGNVGIGHGAIADALKVQLFPLDNEYNLGEEVNHDDAKKAFDGCKTLVELTFPTVEHIENFIQVLNDYKNKHFYEIHEKPKTRRATNRELAKWLAQGNGEWGKIWFNEIKKADISWLYEPCVEKETLQDEIRVRKWDDTEWHKPTVDYMGIE